MNDKDKVKAEAFRSDLGHKATVERWDKSGEASLNMNFELQKIGMKLKADNLELKDAEYLGSAAIHYYKTPLLDHPFFVSQAPLGRVPEVLASHGVMDLAGACQEFYGRKRKTKRSGF